MEKVENEIFFVITQLVAHVKATADYKGHPEGTVPPDAYGDKRVKLVRYDY